MSEETIDVTLEYRENILHPAGVYPAVVVAYEGRSGAFGPRIRWGLDTGMIADNGDPVPPLSYWTGMNAGAKSKLAQFFQALGVTGPRSQEEARSFRLRDACMGRECLVQVEHTEKDGTTWANVVNVMRPPTRRTSLPEPPLPEPPPEKEDPFAEE